MLTRIIALVFAVCVLVGCNTMKGVGQDIERGGEKLQQKADEAKG